MTGPWIAVVGAGEHVPAETLAIAEEAGAAVAEAGAVLVCGGLGGVMEAACRGAKSKLGTTVGLLPGADRLDANGWVDLAIATGMGEMRNALVVRAADVVVAVGGGWGTLTEIAFARKTGKPVVGVGWEIEDVPVAASGAAAVSDALALVPRGAAPARPAHP